MEDDQDEDEDEERRGAGGDEEDELGRKANALVRLALFNEYKRTPLRRDEINKKVMGDQTRSFNAVFQAAQHILQKTFGMELVELMSRAEREREQNGNDGTEAGENATGLKKKVAAAGSKTYILRSALHENLIEAAAATDELILEDEIMGISEDDDEDDDANPRTYGSILSWSSADELGSIGLLYVLLALVLVSGGVLSDFDMKKHLKSLRLPPSAQVNFTAKTTHKTMAIDAYLALLVRQGYLDKVRVANLGASKPTQGKRGRGRNPTADDDSNNIEWKWGSRAQSEVGEVAIADFVAEFLVERMLHAQNVDEESSDDDDDDQRGNRRRGGNARKNGRQTQEEDKDKMLEAMKKGVVLAAGGKLNELK
ncbi:MAGE-domain-containing protein [Rickenella mellea]|uniref:MAGE-domain-containing protein n=1 Tax=Rickenella mellea TaxID=50990 RepID=A0A4Y7Q794_9AGAM|nr:MAGE-domain-containing protein [Rickenella mellea]